jgi:hypothetical protein
MHYLQQMRRTWKLFPKKCPLQTKEAWEFGLGAYTYTGWEQAVKAYIPENAQFRGIVQERKMVNTFLGSVQLKVIEQVFERLRWQIEMLLDMLRFLQKVSLKKIEGTL